MGQIPGIPNMGTSIQLPRGTVIVDKASGKTSYNYQAVQDMVNNNPVPVKQGPSVVNMVMPLVGSLVAGAAAASYMTGADFMSAATAFNGALGATAGLAVSPYLMGMVPSSLRMAFPVAMAIAVPAAVGGELDATVAVMGISASAGAYAVSRYGSQYY